jgi:mono/diheme cytochrome c family protein
VVTDGGLLRLIGSANPLGDFSAKVNAMVNDPDYTAANFRAALSTKPEGWVYGKPSELQQEARERALFQAPGGAEYFLEELRVASNGATARIAATLLAYTYNVPHPSVPVGMPGSLDVFGLAGASLCDPDATPPCDIPAVMPAAPAPADIPAVWEMDGRPRFQWDNSVGSLVYREVLASTSVAGGDAAAVNMDNVLLAGPFTEDLPAYPYPFDVDRPSAARGSRIFRQSCAGCHSAATSILETPALVGTDPNRANVLTDAIVAGLIADARAACTAPECFEPNGDPVPDDEIPLPAPALPCGVAACRQGRYGDGRAPTPSSRTRAGEFRAFYRYAHYRPPEPIP